MQARKILIINKYYKPGYRAGGPIKSIFNLVQILKENYNVKVFTSDCDMGMSNSYESVISDDWNVHDSVNVYYASSFGFKVFIDIINDEKPDVVYLNSFFDFKFSIKLQVLKFLGCFKDIKFLIAPRGELDPGALSISFKKKWLFLKFYKLFNFKKHIFYHATSNLEMFHISNVLDIDQKEILFASNIPSFFNIDQVSIQKKDSFKVVFLSRISPKKNLKYALDVLSNIDFPMSFDIYGPIEDVNYWDDCIHIIDNLPSFISVNFFGEVQSDLVSEILFNYDVFFLPTLAENYCHVIVEALSCGTFVLISDMTPWNNLHSELGCSFPLEDKKLFIEKLHDLYISSSFDNVDSRKNRISLAKDAIGYECSVTGSCRLFNEIMG